MDRRNHRIFQPLLYQVAIAVLAPAEAVRQIPLVDNALQTSLSAYGAPGEKTTFDPALASYRNGVGSITDLNILSTQLLQAKNASTDVYSAVLVGGGLAGVGDRLSPL